jgi:hypothetical protein
MATSDNRSAASKDAIVPIGSFLFVSPERQREVLDEISQGSLPRPSYYLLLAFSGTVDLQSVLSRQGIAVRRCVSCRASDSTPVA